MLSETSKGMPRSSLSEEFYYFVAIKTTNCPTKEIKQCPLIKY